MPIESSLLDATVERSTVVTREVIRTKKIERVDVIGYPGEPLRSRPSHGDIVIRLLEGGPSYATVIPPAPARKVPVAQPSSASMRGLTDSTGRLLDDLLLLRLAMPPAVGAVPVPASVVNESNASEDVGDGSPFVAQALEGCWSNAQDLQRTLSSNGNPSRASRLTISAESRVSVDTNPYSTVKKGQLEAVIRAGFNSYQMPNSLLALWAKEGSLRMTTSAIAAPAASTENNARSLVRSKIFYEQLGSDHFIQTRYDSAARDNVWDNTDDAAPKHEARFRSNVAALVAPGLLADDIGDAVNAELSVASGPPFTVTASAKFYALALLLMDALFTQMQSNTFSQLSSITEPMNYLQWNIGTARFKELLASAEIHRREPAFRQPSGDPISLEQWALHTIPNRKEWFQPRVNAIRFMHYRESYRNIFEAHMNLIKPGIENLPSNRNKG